MGFFHWLALYSNIMANLFGEDREEALSVIDDDAAFDKWLKNYERKNASKNSGKTSLSDDEIDRIAKKYGGE